MNKPEGLPPKLCVGMNWRREDKGSSVQWKCSAPFPVDLTWENGELELICDSEFIAVESLEVASAIVVGRAYVLQQRFSEFLKAK